MKKTIIFLILLFVFFPMKTNAYSTTFYEAEYINDIYMNKVTPDKKTIYFQKARFFRESGSNNFAYCIQPFSFFEANSNYESTTAPTFIDEQTKEKITLISHFGYGYKNHTEPKWYAITQFMIWQIAEPNGIYYFTDTLNGNKIDIYQNEINEINNLINDYYKTPSIADSYHYTTVDQTLKLYDVHNTLYNYTPITPNITIENNTLVIKNLPEGTNILTLKRTETIHNKPILFYYSSTSQNLVETGDISDKIINLRVNVKETELTINKIDADTKYPISSGEGILPGTIYQLYNKNMQKINTLEINEYCTATIKNLPFGKYYLKEIKAGKGYELDPTTYSFELTINKPTITLTLENKILKALVTIKKVYETETGVENENNIVFNIIDNNDKIYKSITTNEEGIAQIYLPYGKYKVEQLTTKEGYTKIDPFEVEIKDTNPQEFNLTNYRIKIPNTQSSIISDIIKVIKKILGIIIYG